MKLNFIEDGIINKLEQFSHIRYYKPLDDKKWKILKIFLEIN